MPHPKDLQVQILRANDAYPCSNVGICFAYKDLSEAGHTICFNSRLVIVVMAI